MRLAQDLDFLLSGLEPLRKLRNALWELLRLHLQLARNAFYQRSFLGVVPEGIHAGVSLNAAGTGANRGLTEHGNGTNLCRGTNVGAAAELDGKWSADFHHAHLVSVVFTEQGHSTHRLSLFQ